MKKLALWQVLLILGILVALAASTVPAQASPTCVQPPAGMVSWWPGDENANDIIGGNHGTLQGDATFAPGKVGRAFSFDGLGDYVSVPHAMFLNPSEITVDAWFYATDITGQVVPPIVKKAGEGTEQQHGYALEINNDRDGTVRFWVFIFGAWYSASSGNAVSTNAWYHVAGTYNGSEIRLYLNGQLEGSTNVAGIFEPSSNPLSIGADPANPDRFFKGLIDEVEIYNRALTGGEIQAIFNADSAGKCKSAVPPVCDVQLNKTSFVNGDQVIAQVARLANPGQNPVPVEVKLWFELPGSPPPVSFLTVGADGSFVLSPGFNTDFGPLNLATVQASFPRGPYSFNCRLLHAVTGALLSEDFNPFQIQ